MALLFHPGTVPFVSQNSKLPEQNIARLLSQLLASVKRLGLMEEGVEGKLLERED